MSVSVGVVNCVVNSVWLMAFSAILCQSVSHIFTDGASAIAKKKIINRPFAR